MADVFIVKPPEGSPDNERVVQLPPEMAVMADRFFLAPGSRSLFVVLVLLTAVVFVADSHTRENLHVGMLYNVCIALTLWSWRPNWVVGVTAASVVLRLISYGFSHNVSAGETVHVVTFNLVVGIAVQVLTGALIWRQMHVQERLEAEEGHTRRQSLELIRALAQAQAAALEAEEATARERDARMREVEARWQEHKTLTALERVQDLSAALSRAVLPQVPDSIAEGRIRLCARYIPAERDIQIGGDFYDLVALDDHHQHYALVIGDVAGHGVEAAAQTALVTSTLRTCAFEDLRGPASVLARAARTLEGQLDSFVSLFYGVYDASSQVLTYANAGHEPPILACGSDIVPLNPTGPIFGVGSSDYGQAEVKLSPGQTLVFLTDGLTEVRRSGGEMLDWEGIAAIVAAQAARYADPDRIADGILSEVWQWAGKARLADDVALLIARVV